MTDHHIELSATLSELPHVRVDVEPGFLSMKYRIDEAEILELTLYLPAGDPRRLASRIIGALNIQLAALALDEKEARKSADREHDALVRDRAPYTSPHPLTSDEQAAEQEGPIVLDPAAVDPHEEYGLDYPWEP